MFTITCLTRLKPKGCVDKARKSPRILCLLSLLLSNTVYAGWEVQWIDTFEGEGVNWNNWTAQTQANYNNEVQCYTADDHSDQRNYDVSNGTLKIIARKERVNCPSLGGQSKSWTSGRLNSKDKREFLYGKLEARIRFHNLEKGTWPAFWMLENRIAEQPIKGDGDSAQWPQRGAGEIDVWEWYAHQPDRYITNFFNAEGCGAEYRYSYPNGAADVLDWHRYSIEWTKEKIDFFIDQTLVVSRDIRQCQQYHEPMFALINLAMGGMLGGAIDPNLQQATLEVDYIAHCQTSETSQSLYCNEEAPRKEPTQPEQPAVNASLSMYQNGVATTEVNRASGQVTVLVDLELDPAEADNYSLYWQAQSLHNPIIDGKQLRFDPISMDKGQYQVGLSLVHIDDVDSTFSKQLYFSVTESDSASGESNTSSAGATHFFSFAALLLLAIWRRKSNLSID